MEEDYDGPEDQGAEGNGSTQVTIRAEGQISVDWLVNEAVERVLAQAEKRLEEVVSEKIDAAVDGAFTKAIDDRVQRAVDEVLDKGFPRFDDYGRNIGVKSLNERVAEHLATKDRYDSRDHLVRLVDENFRHKLDQALTPMVQQAKTYFQQQIDGVLKAKLAEALKKSLGLS